MKEGRTYKVLRNVGSGLGFRLISILLPFILRTVMIRYMGIQYAGLNTLFHSILQVLNMAELGFGSALTFSMYKPLVEKDEEKICQLLNLYKVIYNRLGGVILFLGILMTPFLPYLIKGSYPSDINIYILFWIYIIDTVASYFLFAYMQSLLNADQRSDIVNLIRMGTYTIYNILQIIMIMVFKNYYAYLIFTPICTIVNNILTAVCAKRMYPNYQCKGEISDREKNVIFNKVKALAGHKVGNVLVASLDSVVVSAFLGLTTVGIYGNYYYIITALGGIIDVIHNALIASVGNAIATESKEKIYDIFNKLNFLMAWGMCFCCIGLICLLQPFILLWVGEEGLFPTATMVLSVVYFYSRKSRLIGLGFKDAAGLWEADFWKPYIGAALNLILNIVLVNIMGVNGVYIATIFVMFGVYFPFETRAIFRGIFERSSVEYILQYGFYTFSTVVSCGVAYCCTTLVTINGFGGLIIKGIIGIVSGNFVYLLIALINRNSRRQILALVRDIPVLSKKR